MLKIGYKNLYFISFIALLICNLLPLNMFFLDELVEVFLIIVVLLRIKKIDVKRTVFLLSVFFVIGIMGNLFMGYQRSVLLIMEDFLLLIKFPIALLGTFFLIEKVRSINRLEQLMYYTISFFSLIVFCDSMVILITGNVFLPSTYSKVNGMYAFLFFTFVFCYYRPDVDVRRKKRCNIMLLSINIITIILTSSTVSLLMFLAFIIYTMRFYIRKHYKVLLILSLPVISVVVFFLVNEKIQGYFLTEDAPRRLLYSDAFKALTACLPIGYGFSLYGGKVAAEYYSPVYTDLGWNSIWTVREGSPFLLDSFFPSILGETGLLGSIIYIMLLKNVLCRYLINKRISNAFVLAVIIFISGVSSNILNSGWGVVSCFIVAMIYRKQEAIVRSKDILLS